MREQAKVKINNLVRFHQPQEDVDTIRRYDTISMAKVVEDYMHDNCFHVQNSTPRMNTDYNNNPKKKNMMMFMLSLKQINGF